MKIDFYGQPISGRYKQIKDWKAVRIHLDKRSCFAAFAKNNSIKSIPNYFPVKLANKNNYRELIF